VDDLWATKSKDVGLIVHAISFQDFQPMWSWSTNVSDGQTDRWADDMWSQDHALQYSASRSNKTIYSIMNACPNSQGMSPKRYTRHPNIGHPKDLSFTLRIPCYSGAISTNDHSAANTIIKDW